MHCVCIGMLLTESDQGCSKARSALSPAPGCRAGPDLHRLDSSTTYLITRCIRNFVHMQDATVLMALLQPAPETFDLFDDVMLLSEGDAAPAALLTPPALLIGALPAARIVTLLSLARMSSGAALPRQRCQLGEDTLEEQAKGSRLLASWLVAWGEPKLACAGHTAYFGEREGVVSDCYPCWLHTAGPGPAQGASCTLGSARARCPELLPFPGHKTGPGAAQGASCALGSSRAQCPELLPFPGHKTGLGPAQGTSCALGSPRASCPCATERAACG